MMRHPALASLGRFSAVVWFTLTWVLTGCSWAFYFADVPLFGLLSAFLLAAYQGQALRKYVQPVSWSAATSLGQLVIYVTLMVSLWSLPPAAPLIVTVGGLIAVSLQWVTVKNVASRPAIWFMNAVAFGIAEYTSYVIVRRYDLHGRTSAAAFGIIAGLIVAMASTSVIRTCLTQGLSKSAPAGNA